MCIRDRLYPKQSVELEMTFQNIMSVDVPEYHFKTRSQDPGEVYPYGFAQTSGELDDAVDAMSQVFQDMLKLAEIEKTSQLLAEEIEKTRRRVNALEYVKIPQMQEAIKYISMKLDENERSNTCLLYTSSVWANIWVFPPLSAVSLPAASLAT